MYQSTMCLTGRHAGCSDAACRCWLCDCKRRNEAAAQARSKRLLAESALAAATVTFNCQDCGQPVPEGFVLCDDCHWVYSQQASPYERAEHRRERGRTLL